MEEKKQIETKRERSKSPKTKGGLENKKATANPHDIEVKEVTLASTLTEAGYRHAVHCMIFARWDDHYVLEEYKPHAAVLVSFLCWTMTQCFDDECEAKYRISCFLLITDAAPI